MIRRILGFTAAFLLLAAGLSWVFMPKNNLKKSGIDRWGAQAVLAEEKDTVDVLGIGDSDMWAGFTPMELWKRGGITAYNCGSSGQSVWESYHLLTRIFARQSPKVVFFETDSVFVNPRGIRQAEDVLKEAVQEYFPVFEYHNRWKNLTWKDIFSKRDYRVKSKMKGFKYSSDVFPYRGGNYMGRTLTPQAIEFFPGWYLEKIIKLCRENGARLILISIPSAAAWNMGRHKSMAEYAKTHGVDYLDFNTRLSRISFDWQWDSRDGGNHLNYQGALKVTGYLYHLLEGQAGIKDHRQEKRYRSWAEAASKYDEKVAGM